MANKKWITEGNVLKLINRLTGEVLVTKEIKDGKESIKEKSESLKEDSIKEKRDADGSKESKEVRKVKGQKGKKPVIRKRKK